MKTENTRLTCPECGGAVQRLEDGGPTQYRCRIGHLYSTKSALAIHAEREENTLWSAVVLLQEGAELAEEISKQPSLGLSETLGVVAAAKRQLAERIKVVVSDFVRIPMPLEESDSHDRPSDQPYARENVAKQKKNPNRTTRKKATQETDTTRGLFHLSTSSSRMYSSIAAQLRLER